MSGTLCMTCWGRGTKRVSGGRSHTEHFYTCTTCNGTGFQERYHRGRVYCPECECVVCHNPGSAIVSCPDCEKVFVISEIKRKSKRPAGSRPAVQVIQKELF